MINDTQVLGNCTPWSNPNQFQGFFIRCLLFSVYASIGVVGFAGNLIVLGVIVVTSELTRQFATNYFVANLALNDLMLICTSLWLQPITTVTGQWIFGKVACKVSHFLASATFTSCAATLALIAVDRFHLILYPHRLPMRKLYIILSIGGIWVLSFAFSAPQVLNIQHITVPGCNNEPSYHFCVPSAWEPEYMRVIYGIFRILAQLIVPLAIISICYFKIGKRLYAQQTRITAVRSQLNNQRRENNQRARRVQRILVCMVAIFGVCSGPMEILSLLNDLDWVFYESSFFSFSTAQSLMSTAHLVAMTAMIWNPLLYAWCSENLRAEIRSRSRSVAQMPLMVLGGVRENLQRSSLPDFDEVEV